MSQDVVSSYLGKIPLKDIHEREQFASVRRALEVLPMGFHSSLASKFFFWSQVFSLYELLTPIFPSSRLPQLLRDHCGACPGLASMMRLDLSFLPSSLC